MPSSTLMSSIPHLQRHTVRELLDNKKDPIPLVDISNDAPVEEALDLLLAGDILTLPVYMTGTESTKKQYIGLISAYDLLHFLTLHAPSLDDTTLSQALGASIQDVLEQTSISTSIPFVSLDASVHKLMTEMSHFHQQRALINSDPTPNIISEIDLARFLTQHFDLFSSQLDITIEELLTHQPTLFQTPTTIPLHKTAWDAFQKLNEAHVDALAIVDRYGEIITECTAADLSGLNPKRLEELHRPILVYLRSRTGGKLPIPFTCRKSFTLSQCLAGIVRFNVHHVWILDDEDIPIYELTLRNILSLFL